MTTGQPGVHADPTLVAAAEAGFDTVAIVVGQPPWTLLHFSGGLDELLEALPSGRRAPSGNGHPGAQSGLPLPEQLPKDLAAEMSRQCNAVKITGRRTEGFVDIRDHDGSARASVQYAITPVDDVCVCVFRRVHRSVIDLPWGDPRGDFDALTGVGTRVAVRGALEGALRKLRDSGEGFTVVYLDVDGLKEINDTFGHPVGDSVLEEVGSRLRGMVRGSDFVGRLGGDEFVVVWPGICAEATARRMHQRILRALEKPMDFQGAALRVTASAGALLVSEPQERDADDLLRDADAAMYEAKARRDGELVVFEPSMTATVLGSLVTAGELRSAVRRGQLELHGQPILDITNGRTAGVELLLRWRHPHRGLLGPGDFLAAADASDVMTDVGEWVLESAVSTVAHWERSGQPLDYYRVGINVTPRQLLRSDIVEMFEEALLRHNTSADHFVFEVVESQVLDSASRAAEQVRGLRELGARVGIDDFGNGFANLANLRDLPVDLIKVDRRLVGIHPTNREAAILSAVQSIASAISADVVLEGVERESQLRVARSCGVRFAQGFLLGMPQPLGDTPPLAFDPTAG